MNCKDTKRAVKSLICGEEADISSIREHLSDCPRCEEEYSPFLAIVGSLESGSIPRLDNEGWREFSAKLHARIREERPAPLGRWHSVLLWAGQSRLLHFRRAFAGTLVALAILGAFLAFLPGLRTGEEGQGIIAKEVSTPAAAYLPELPPAALDAISILGDYGFVGAVSSGDIRPGDFIAGQQYDAHDIIEAMDYLLERSPGQTG
jgi:hypothetical protein